MNLLQGIINGFSEIWAHKLRSSLTLCCVLLGVVSLVSITGCIQGLFLSWKIGISEGGGLEKIAILDAQPPDEQKAMAKTSGGRTLKDAETIAANSKYAKYVSPEIDFRNARIRHKDKFYKCRIVQGVTEGIFHINKYDLEIGQYITESNVLNTDNVVVLGSALVKNLYAPDEEILGSTITINGVPFTVTGTLIGYELLGDGERNWLRYKNEVAFIPITTMQKKVMGKPDINWLNVQITDVSKMREAVDELDNIMTHAHRGVHNFEITTQEENIEQYNSMVKKFFMVGGGIGAVTLVVGGIGIFNLMLASINERVREIGIRKALGAWNRDIFIQFFSEAVSLSVSGGITGIIVSFGLIKLLQQAFPNSPPQFSIVAVLVGLSFSILVGIVSGIYPAMKASRLDPIDALRYE
jgi:putative ABC transport system permease protein